MIEKRAFHRVPFATKVILTDNDTTLLGRLNNISFGGALVRLEHETMLLQDSKYSLTIHVGKDAPPLHMIAEVACVSLSTVGLKFTSIDCETKERLALLMSDIEKIKYVQSEKKRNSTALNPASAR